MRNQKSELTFYDLAETLPYIKVFWNGECVFDDDEAESLEYLRKFQDKYGKKVVYKMMVQVVSFHHVILRIMGEK